jgi:hypothetical protein
MASVETCFYVPALTGRINAALVILFPYCSDYQYSRQEQFTSRACQNDEIILTAE